MKVSIDLGAIINAVLVVVLIVMWSRSGERMERAMALLKEGNALAEKCEELAK